MGSDGILTNSVATDCEGNPMSTSSCCSSPAEMLPAKTKMGRVREGGETGREGRFSFSTCVLTGRFKEKGRWARRGEGREEAYEYTEETRFARGQHVGTRYEALTTLVNVVFGERRAHFVLMVGGLLHHFVGRLQPGGRLRHGRDGGAGAGGRDRYLERVPGAAAGG